MASQQETLALLKKHTAYDLATKLADLQHNSQILKIFKFAAKQGGLRSYIIYMLYRDGKTYFWEIVKESGFSRSHVYLVLRSLKNEGIIDNEAGWWFLIHNTTVL